MQDCRIDLGLLVEEYTTIIHESSPEKNSRGETRWNALENRLVGDAEWTVEGARHLSLLVRTYGAFILRNAAALAIALDLDDGEAGL